MFARRANGRVEPDTPMANGDIEPMPPPAGNAMADAMLKKMFGVGVSDLQTMADSAGQVLATYDKRLAIIEGCLTEILDIVQRIDIATAARK